METDCSGVDATACAEMDAMAESSDGLGLMPNCLLQIVGVCPVQDFPDTWNITAGLVGLAEFKHREQELPGLTF